MNQICHFEIGCRDRGRTSKFYGDLFGWKVDAQEHATYLRTDGDVGGHVSSLGHEPHNYTIFYVLVEDIQAAISKAEGLGGRKIVGPIPLPRGGTFAWIADPEGNTVGLYTETKQ